jgi:uncharacterized UBP type Zn finger protein
MNRKEKEQMKRELMQFAQPESAGQTVPLDSTGSVATGDICYIKPSINSMVVIEANEDEIRLRCGKFTWVGDPISFQQDFKQPNVTGEAE